MYTRIQTAFDELPDCGEYMKMGVTRKRTAYRDTQLFANHIADLIARGNTSWKEVGCLTSESGSEEIVSIVASMKSRQGSLDLQPRP